jgi:hypothetical protein
MTKQTDRKRLISQVEYLDVSCFVEDVYYNPFIVLYVRQYIILELFWDLCLTISSINGFITARSEMRHFDTDNSFWC